MKKEKVKTVRRLAQIDISKYFVDNNIDYRPDENGDIWNVTAAQLIDDEIQILNRALGLHRINKARNHGH